MPFGGSQLLQPPSPGSDMEFTPLKLLSERGVAYQYNNYTMTVAHVDKNTATGMATIQYPRKVVITQKQADMVVNYLDQLFKYLTEPEESDSMMIALGSGLYLAGSEYLGERKGHIRYYFSDCTGAVHPTRKGVTLDASDTRALKKAIGEFVNSAGSLTLEPPVKVTKLNGPTDESVTEASTSKKTKSTRGRRRVTMLDSDEEETVF